MIPRNAPLHVYAREISQKERTSLSVLASLVRPGATVLDLGCGSGALGRFLQEQSQCTLDGVTLNKAEAELARPFYRRVEVANLENCDLPTLFAGQQYDHIICADVLEHLRAPEQTLAACRQLLTAQGEVLISIPNAAYAGLIGELMLGEFTYREEGLLDNTHLRFFTRQSLGRFLHAQGWGIQALDTIQRPLPESEFKVHFDRLPPAVTRYLLALPDALTYQFIATARPGIADIPVEAQVSTEDHALFTACLYLGEQGHYAEDRKLETTGIVGQLRQVLRFHLPADGAFTQLRLDPADRPGFLHLHTMTLKSAAGQTLWQWSMQTDGLALLEKCAHSGMLMQAPASDVGNAMVLLHNDDPWLELPLSSQAIQAAGGCLEIELGWPMSADFLALSGLVHGDHAAQQQQLERWNEASATWQKQKQAVDARCQALEESRGILLTQMRGLLATRSEERQVFEEERRMFQAIAEHRESLLAHLSDIENSTVFKATRPLVRLKMWLSARLRRTQAPEVPAAPLPLQSVETADSTTTESATPPPPSARTVDVIVPVYRGLEDTQRCIRSALACTLKTPWRLIVINDCSPEPEVTHWLHHMALLEPRVILLENQQNLGFVATVNRGMSLSASNDVVLLNSDTEVANDWLDRLDRAAHTHGRVGTVTPFSNNATICSYPYFCQPNELPEAYDTARLDALFARTHPGEVLDIPTGIGFCMYIRRDCLAEVGLFDVESFGKGYGEENDFCRRAAVAGWRNLHALDTFVRHAGGVSFGESKSEREQAAMAVLRHMHPDYEPMVHAFVAADPARPYRHMIDLARLRESERPPILTVVHHLGGGTLRHAEELAKHLLPRAVSLSLVPLDGGKVQLKWLDPREPFELSFLWPTEVENLVLTLQSIGIRHVHFHHLLGHDPEVMSLPARLGVAYDFTAHDYYAVCPQVSLTTGPSRTYCGEEGVAQCRACLGSRPAPDGSDIETWRSRYGSFVAQARHLLVPSRDAARRFMRYVPSADICFAPHTDMPSPTTLPLPAPQALAPHTHLRVLVIGALSQIKGADVLEATALEAARTKAPLEFHLAGYAHRRLQTQPHASLTLHGPYVEQDLAMLLERLQPNLVWFPAQWPETYSYTLSACLQNGVAIVAPDLGAFTERLSGRPWTWLKPWDLHPADWVAFFSQIRNQHFVTSHPPTTLPMMPISEADSFTHQWSYDSEYLQDLPVCTTITKALSLPFVEAHLPGWHPDGSVPTKLTLAVEP